MEKSLDILWEKVQGMQKALDLQAEEYERRLTALNGEGERIKEVLKDSIPREVFDRTMSANEQKNDARAKELSAKIEILTAWQTAQQGSTSGKDRLITWVPYVIAVLALALAFFRK